MAELTSNGRPELRLAQLEGARHVLVLSGYAGPLAGVSWGVRQRGDVSRAPGSTRGRALLLGPEEQAIPLDFKWRTRDLRGSNDAMLDGGPVEDADDLVRAVGDLVRDGAIVELTWRGERRLGFLRESEPAEGFAGEYEVSLEYEVLELSRLQRTASAAAATAASATAAEAAGSYDDELSRWTDTVRTIRRPATAPSSVVAGIESAAVGINAAFRAAPSSAFRAPYGARPPATVVRAMAATFSAISDAGEAFADASSYGSADLAQTDEPRAAVGALAFRASAQRAGYALRRRAYIQAARLSASTDPAILGIHSALEGEDLRLVVLRWGYPSPDAWRAVASYNGLAGPLLEAGQRIKIPRPGAAL